MVRMIFDPDDKDSFYRFVDIKFGLYDSDNIESYFEAFKSFCHAVGFSLIDDYEMVLKSDNDYQEDDGFCGDHMEENYDECDCDDCENCGEHGPSKEEKIRLLEQAANYYEFPGFIGKSEER